MPASACSADGSCAAVADRIDAVLWFSDLRGFTRITDTAPPSRSSRCSTIMPTSIVSAIHEQGGDVLKLIGDGTLAIFTADDRARRLRRALDAAIAARSGVAALNQRRAAARPAGHRRLSRPACRRGVLRQYRQPRAARLHRDRPGGQRGQPHRRDVPLGRPGRSCCRRPSPAVGDTASAWSRSAATRCAACHGRRSCSPSIRTQ